MELLADRPKPTMSDRRAELERKKARLQQLREEKERRRRDKELQAVKDSKDRVQVDAGGDRKDIDKALTDFGIAPLSEIFSSISSANSLTPEPSRNHTPETSLQLNSLPNK